MPTRVPHFNSGDIVEVKSLEEIRATLDSNGMYEGVPFMAEMHRFCGGRYRVFKRTDKICVEREYSLDFRRMRNAVLLDEIRCDGSDHDGCQKLCMIFWKEAWLKPAPPLSKPAPPVDWVQEKLPMRQDPVDESKSYSCQSTAVLGATEPLKVWDLRQYARDLRSGALKPVELAGVLGQLVYNKVATKLRKPEFGAVLGSGTKTPSVSLGLRRGESVRVKSRAEIVDTLDAKGRNRGLYFAYDMERHCGRSLKVIAPVDRMILETTGKMKKMSNTVLLRGGECTGLCNRGCARKGHPLWREAWLERIGEAGNADPSSASSD
jgi:hypothetical protein